MRKVFFSFFTLLFIFNTASAMDIIELRKIYYKAAGNKSSAERFIALFEHMQVDDKPILLCYKGMAYLFKANYSINPYSKFSYFNQGKEMLEKAIETDPENIEIRFMRFCVQTNAPFFLGYRKDIIIDKVFILKKWSSISDIDLKNKIRAYILESNNCTASEKNLLK